MQLFTVNAEIPDVLAMAGDLKRPATWPQTSVSPVSSILRQTDRELLVSARTDTWKCTLAHGVSQNYLSSLLPDSEPL